MSSIEKNLYTIGWNRGSIFFLNKNINYHYIKKEYNLSCLLASKEIIKDGDIFKLRHFQISAGSLLIVKL